MSNSLHDLGQDASKLVHDRVIDPAKDLLQDAKTAVQKGAQQAGDVLVADAALAQESLSRMCKQTGRWIAANPFTSVSLALVVGAAAAAASKMPRG